MKRKDVDMPGGNEPLISRVLIDMQSRMARGVFMEMGLTKDIQHLAGKMLRTRLAQSLAGEDWHLRFPHLVQACSALELIHSASLFHDDVVDGASLRRGKPALWRLFTPSSAVLIGDMLFCEALSALLETGNNRLFRLFNEKVKEVCMVEAQQELLYRGKRCDTETCLKVARGKTGPLFAFAAMVCAGDDFDLEKALEEAGYRIGCAYQIADDLVDENSTEALTGKTLGTDRLRRKFTLAQENAEGAREILKRLRESAAYPLARWPEHERRLKRFMEEDFSHVVSHVAVRRESEGFEGAFNDMRLREKSIKRGDPIGAENRTCR
jgi:geranylgeranyl pyrophosphate synthase